MASPSRGVQVVVELDSGDDPRSAVPRAVAVALTTGCDQYQ
ncbi:hypothetical protein [Streptomyces sp. CC0208]|nr:hypothetical protein [Streptomyces sp. CC0208]